MIALVQKRAWRLLLRFVGMCITLVALYSLFATSPTLVAGGGSGSVVNGTVIGTTTITTYGGSRVPTVLEIAVLVIGVVFVLVSFLRRTAATPPSAQEQPA